MIGQPPATKTTTYEYLSELIANINANQGTINCGHCALRLDLHIREGRNLALGPVTNADSQLLTYPQFKEQTLIRSYTKDNRLMERCASDKGSSIIEICNLEDENPQFVIDLTYTPPAENSLKLYRATLENIYKQLRDLPRRNKDNTSYGFLMLTHAKNQKIGHIINFFVDNDDEVYFLDAQRKMSVEQISKVLDLTGFRPEIFFIPSHPPEGYKPTAVKKEKNVGDHLFSGFIDYDEDEAKKLKDAVKADPENVSAWVNLGQYYSAKNLDKYAKNIILCYEKAVQLDPNQKNILQKYWLFKGLIAPSMVEAIACYEKALSQNITEKKAQAVMWYNIAKKCGQNGLWDFTNHCLLYAYQCDNLNPTLWHALKLYYDMVKDLEKSNLCAANIERINKGLAPEPLNVNSLRSEGITWHFSNGNIPCPNLNRLKVMLAPRTMMPSPSAPIAAPRSGIQVSMPGIYVHRQNNFIVGQQNRETFPVPTVALHPKASEPAKPPAAAVPVPSTQMPKQNNPMSTQDICPVSPPAALSLAIKPSAVIVPVPGSALEPLVQMSPTFLPSKNPAPLPTLGKREVDWLKDEVGIKQRRIEIMQAEIDMKDAQIAELKKQLSEKEEESKKARNRY